MLMLPGIPVLGINQINQLISNRFASFIDSGVSYTYGAYRVTELVFGAIVVQLTTVLLPVLSRELRLDPGRRRGTLVGTITLVSFVTLPAATVMAVLAQPIIGLLFGGGRFRSQDVAVTGVTLTAYAFSLVGTGHVKVMASAFFAQKNTRTPMWGSLMALIVFTGACAAGRALRDRGSGMGEHHRHGLFRSVPDGALCAGDTAFRGSAAATSRPRWLARWSRRRCWRAGCTRCGRGSERSITPRSTVRSVLRRCWLPLESVYVGVVTLLGGREMRLLASALERRRFVVKMVIQRVTRAEVRVGE